MVVKMRWPWPPQLSKKFEVKIVLRRLEEFHIGNFDGEKPAEVTKLSVEIRWKGPKFALSSFRRSVKRNFTKEEEFRSDDGVVEWNEDFQSVCNLSAYKENVFHPWEIGFTVLNGLNQGLKNKVPVVGTASLNLAEFASAAAEKEVEVNIPLSVLGGSADSHHPSLCLSLSLVELRTVQESPETEQRSTVPAPLSPRAGEVLPTEKDELSALKAGLRKVKILKEYVSTRRAKKSYHEEDGSEGRCSGRSEDEYIFPFDTDSLDDCDERELGVEDDSSVRKSFSYGTLAYANCVGGSYISEMRINGENEDWVYYSNRKSDVGCVKLEDSIASVSVQSLLQSSKRRSILSWRKRKLNFRSPKAKGEPLLKKAYAEEGGDDIDYDRRQLSSSDESTALAWHKADEDSTANRSSVSEFGDDSFAVGSWEHKGFVSRDGHMKLRTHVFFASIDQRSERAAGESACTALVAVIANWFQANRDSMPIKSQFDTLIREGSLEWRNLCENETYMEKFPDKHFDLETVLQAKIRPITIASEKSFVGFFYPEGMEGGGFEFLQGAMSFDGIWDEISCGNVNNYSNGEPQVYIVSWNDHFFILKVEQEAYYIIDTLGERLYEGCNQAYILKFDRDTKIHRVPDEEVEKSLKEKQAIDQQILATTTEMGNQKIPDKISKGDPTTNLSVVKSEISAVSEGKEEEVLCKGKESCKEYIKNFLAAIPIRELQADIKKGLMASTPIHHRLQIEFHYIEFLQPLPEPSTMVATEGTC
ncbi:EEIG1/EHBP1 N-terminal domain [Macleaya cordata]|uniref:EEIG1/EHBP1 N-terminal domain n=1 Tax=Macleaya cordata TaxID=56857 RepID=A0A200R333_MACCD|nr:EEIG1/EHBP1 N-terminal domain [Macleaya cordata]